MPRLLVWQACCWPVQGSGSPEAGGEEEAERRDHGPRSPLCRLSNRGIGVGRTEQLAGAPASGRGCTETLQGEREGEKLIH